MQHGHIVVLAVIGDSHVLVVRIHDMGIEKGLKNLYIYKIQFGVM